MEHNDIATSADQPRRQPRRIGIFLFDLVEEIDAIGPWEASPGGRITIPTMGGTQPPSSRMAAPATSNRNRLGQMTSIDGTIDVRRGGRFVDDGDVITAAGLSAGIDMALHVVGRLAGAEVRESIEYAPDPPHRHVPAPGNRDR
jgi:hypothetical protein